MYRQLKKLFYKKKGNTTKYKFLGLTIYKKTKTPNKKIYKILGIKIAKKRKSKHIRLTFADNLKNCSQRFDNQTKFNRLAVFASFNKDGLILDYVVYYLTELKKVVDGIIFVTDNPILPSELDKIKDIVIYVQCQRHEEYDFGSYKRGFFWAKENGLLTDCTELVLCNDSCVGPFYPFSEMFETMAKHTCDFWGMTKNIERHEHIQSYFLVLKETIFKSDNFIKFFSKIVHQATVRDVIDKYEIGLSQFLFQCGYTADSYVPYKYDADKYPYIFHKNTTIFPVFLLEQKAPLVKVKALQNNFNIEGISKLSRYLKNKQQKQFITIPVPPSEKISFSLIMPTYNRRNFIGKSIDSVLRLSYQNFELIIVDDGSTDGTESFIRKNYAKELQSGKIVYISKVNEGVCKARNMGLKAAKNDWIGYVDSDNLVFPNFLDVFVSAISENQNKTYYSLMQRMSDRKVIGKSFDYAKLMNANYIDLGCFIHHKSVYSELGGFDENLTRLVDWDLILTYTQKYIPTFIPIATLLYNNIEDHIRISSSEKWNDNYNKIKQKHKIKITTIITAYNHEQYIEEAIKSAIAQEGDFIHEIIISDDASSDTTPEIIAQYTKKYPNLIKNISSKQNLGISKNMKKCFKQATGQYIAILEGDDYWTDKNKLQKQSLFLMEHTDCSMVFNKIKILNQQNGKLSLLTRQNNLPEKLTGDDFLADNSQNLIANFSSCLFISDYIKSLPQQLYNTRFNEIALAFYLDTKGYIGFIEQPMSVYRQHINSVWTGGDKNKKLEEALKIRQICKNICADKYKEKFDQIINKLYRQIKK